MERLSREVRIGLAVILGLMVSLTHRGAAAQSPNQVALVVQTEPGNFTTHCVTASESEISGLDVLLGTGLNVVYSGGSSMGAAICKIGDQGCDSPASCFCQCKGAACLYWSYWHLIDGEWQYAALGASYAVKPGAVVGWVWGIGTPRDAPKPPTVRFEDVCRAETATPLPTLTSTPTGTPTSTNTPVPTRTPSPAPTQTAVPSTAQASSSPAPTATPTATPMVPSTATPTVPPTTTPKAPPSMTPTAVPRPSTATPTPSSGAVTAESPSPGLRNYAIFGGMAVLLVLIGVLVRRRQR